MAQYGGPPLSTFWGRHHILAAVAVTSDPLYPGITPKSSCETSFAWKISADLHTDTAPLAKHWGAIRVAEQATISIFHIAPSPSVAEYLERTHTLFTAIVLNNTRDQIQNQPRSVFYTGVYLQINDLQVENRPASVNSGLFLRICFPIIIGLDDLADEQETMLSRSGLIWRLNPLNEF